MIRDLDALVFSLHNARGVYALLIGSGVSRAAEIPTGWEVIEDLVRKVAEVQGKKISGRPGNWYQAETGEEPSYSMLLEQLASSRHERQALLRQYFEPSEEDREQGQKLPTEAHRAIARLVNRGIIKVILTTNFDRLVEMAIEEEGVIPTVLSTTAAIKGAPPLVHSRCTVIKLHGDYLDTNLRNTEAELAKYPGELSRLLRRILDEYGLIVCGWSGDWDTALYDSLASCKNQRYTTFWAAYKGELTDTANKLVIHRRARVLCIDDADAFFSDLVDRVDALEAVDRPAPLSKEIATAQLKKYLPEERYRIRLNDLIKSETERVYDSLSLDRCPVDGVPFDAVNLENRLKGYAAATEILEHLAAVGAYWSEKHHTQIWVEMLNRLGNPPEPSRWNTAWRNLQWYPATRLLYSAGLGALAADNYSLLWQLLTTPLIRRTPYGQDPLPLLLLANSRSIDRTTLNKVLNQNYYVPGSELLFSDLRPSLEALVPDDYIYESCFDRFEVLAAAVTLWLGEPTALGRFAYKVWRSGSAVHALIQEAQEKGADWSVLRQGFFNNSLDDATRTLTELSEVAARAGYR